MIEQYIKNVIEAALLAAGRSLSYEELGQLFGDAERPDIAALHAAVRALDEEYAGRAMELRETASGVRIQVRREFNNELARLWPERTQRYSRALLETLALIAYRQPITRAEIEAVRGVAVNPNITRTLMERNWVRVVGTRDLPGRPELLGTTRDFLDYFGLKSLDDLPPLEELKSFGEMDPQLALPVAEPQIEAAPAAVAAGDSDDDEEDEEPPAAASAAGEGLVAQGLGGDARSN